MMDDFTAHKLDVITSILLSCEEYSKENLSPRQSIISPISLTDSFKASSPDSLQKLWGIIHWSIFEFFIPNVKLLYQMVINMTDILIRNRLSHLSNLDDGGRSLDIPDNENIINKLIENSIFSAEEIQIQKHKVKQYCFHGCKMNFVGMMNLRKAQIEMELQHRKMELVRFEWINESSISEKSLIRQQVNNILIHN